VSGCGSLVEGLCEGVCGDPDLGRMGERDLADGQHRNPAPRDYFTTAYFHRPDELEAEVLEAGFATIELVGIEGPGDQLPDLAERWVDPAQRELILWAARAGEHEPSLLGLSDHHLVVARR